MNKKIFTGSIIAVFVVLLMVSSVTAMNLTQNNSVFEKTDNEKDSFVAKQDELESSNSPEEEKPAGIFRCLLIIQTTCSDLGGMDAPGVKVRCENKKDSSDVHTRTSRGFFALAIFFSLKRGATYKVSAPDYGNANNFEITMSGFVIFKELRVS